MLSVSNQHQPQALYMIPTCINQPGWRTELVDADTPKKLCTSLSSSSGRRRGNLLIDGGSVRCPDTAIFQIPLFSICKSPENQTDGVWSDNCLLSLIRLTLKITGQNCSKNYTKGGTEEQASGSSIHGLIYFHWRCIWSPPLYLCALCQAMFVVCGVTFSSHLLSTPPKPIMVLID